MVIQIDDPELMTVREAMTKYPDKKIGIFAYKGNKEFPTLDSVKCRVVFLIDPGGVFGEDMGISQDYCIVWVKGVSYVEEVHTSMIGGLFTSIVE